MTPPLGSGFEWLPFNQNIQNRNVSAGASHKPYGMNDPFLFNQPIGNLQRVGGVMTPPTLSNTNLLGNWA